MQVIILSISFSIVIFILYNLVKKKATLPQPTSDNEKKILQQYVVFYQRLNENDKIEFEKRVQNFLQKVRIKGIDTEIEDRDNVFVAAAAIIPIFAFKGWEYHNIHDVLIYPNSFDKNFKTVGPERDLLGMVGTGAMQNLMILSIQELRDGFLNANSTSNAAIHEFVHLVDKDDGYADGCPENLLPHKYSLPWLKRIHQEVELIEKGKSDINPYGATNEAEFLAVAAEYFFKQPDKMELKHPALFDLLKKVFVPTNN